jgi:serine/threonine-protein kinase
MAERFGQYELVQKIAAGGMAEIFFARLTGVQGFTRNLVVKRMLPELAVRKDFVQMFLDEARLAANLGHANIVQVFELGEVDGSYFMAMEFVDGPHLGALFAHSLRQRKPLPVEFCAYIMARSADGLHFAHELEDGTGSPLQIVHRDISPQNILVSRFGDVKVTDFGVAKATSQGNKTRTGIIKGKVSYMSPEQCLAEDLDRRTDIFAMGIVLYELLTRRRLYREKSDLKVMQRITQEETKPASHLNPKVDQELDDIVLTALAKDRDSRFDTAADFAEALDRWLVGQQKSDCKNAMAKWIKVNTDGVGPVVKPSSSEPASKATPSWGIMGKRVEGEASSTKSTPSLANRVSPLAVGQGDDPDEGQTLILPPDDMAAQAAEPTVRASMPPGLAEDDAAQVATEESRGHGAALDPALADVDDGPTDKSLETLGLPHLTYDVQPTTERSPLALGGAIALFLLLLVGGYFFFLGGDADVDPQDPDVATAVDASTPVVAPVVAKKIPLKIATFPAGVFVSVNGQEAGKSPVEVPVAEGKVQIRALFTDQPPLTKEIEVSGEGPFEVEIAAKVPLVAKSEPPGALITVHEQMVGMTPRTLLATLEPGVKTKIEMKLDGYLPFSSTVIAEKGKPKQVSVTLKPVPKKKTRKADPPPRAPGNLSLNTNPYTVVYLDKKKLGPTPLINEELPAGSHRLTLRNPELGISTSLWVKIASKKVTTKNLKIEMGKLSFDGLPPGVSVTVDGKALGNTPLRPLAVYPGNRRVILVEGGKKRTVKATVAAGKTKRVR